MLVTSDRKGVDGPVGPRTWLVLAAGMALGCSETAELATALTEGDDEPSPRGLGGRRGRARRQPPRHPS